MLLPLNKTNLLIITMIKKKKVGVINRLSNGKDCRVAKITVVVIKTNEDKNKNENKIQTLLGKCE